MRRQRGFIGMLVLGLLLVVLLVAPLTARLTAMHAEQMRQDREVAAALEAKPPRVQGLADEAALKASIEAQRAIEGR